MSGEALCSGGEWWWSGASRCARIVVAQSEIAVMRVDAIVWPG